MELVQNELINELVTEQLLSPEEVLLLEAISKKSSLPLKLTDILESLDRSKSFVVLRYLAQKCDSEFQEKLPQIELPEEIINKIKIEYLKKHTISPIMIHNETLIVAVYDSIPITPIKNISLITGYQIKTVVTFKENVLEAINKLQELQAQRSQELALEAANDVEKQKEILFEETEDLLDMAKKPPVIKLVNSLIYEALKERATDIHFHPVKDALLVKYRIDGMLHQVHSLSFSMRQVVISRIKIMSQLDIAEKRFPQDGRMSITYKNELVDVRVSVLPLYHGQRAVLRILDKRNLFHDLADLGMRRKTYETLALALKKKHGLLFVSGPTGSGKTTTLYACLSAINALENNIVTIEDPVEYSLSGISQMQVNLKVGFQFADGLRSILRHDPDVIMVGEVRDPETARIAVRASLTGHLVVSTVHTHNAPETLLRLLDLGIEPYLLASSLSLIISQRLIRKVCTHCAEEWVPSPQWFAQWKKYLGDIEKTTYVYPKGCNNCRNTGFKGRIGIFEIIGITDAIKRIIKNGSDMQTLGELLYKNKEYTPLFESGISKVVKGLTTVEEVFRVVHS
ncbi:GspE/PulE family protein [Chlamydiota bacterium]